MNELNESQKAFWLEDQQQIMKLFQQLGAVVTDDGKDAFYVNSSGQAMTLASVCHRSGRVLFLPKSRRPVESLSVESYEGGLLLAAACRTLGLTLPDVAAMAPSPTSHFMAKKDFVDLLVWVNPERELVRHRCVYRAEVDGVGTDVIVDGDKSGLFYLGQQLRFAARSDVTYTWPNSWRDGVIRRIAFDQLFIEQMRALWREKHWSP